MAVLYGREYGREELRAFMGNAAQAGGIKMYEFADGFGRGVRAADFRTGSGFDFTALIDRGLDIGHCSYCGIPVAWRSPSGEVAPAFFESGGAGWLRSFGGGLTATCGLAYAGAACVDEGQPLGLHGRIGNSPASEIRVAQEWIGDDLRLSISGSVRESALFGENLVLRRTITAFLGSSKLTIEDDVSNEGFGTAPHMMLYHINIGHPIVAPGSRLAADSLSVTPRDEEAAAGAEDWNAFEAPEKGYKEKVYYHDLIPDGEGRVKVSVRNPRLRGGKGLGVYVDYFKPQLPRFIQWKQMGQGAYVLGLEPANCLVEGRSAERARGTLQFLEPGETRSYKLEIGVFE